MTEPLVASHRAPGLHIAPGVRLPDDTEIAPYVSIYGGVELGAGVVLGQGCILGRPQQVDARSRAPRRAPGAPTLIGAGCMIGSATVVTAGASLGDGTHVGDHVLLRETAVLGRAVLIGRGSSVGYETLIGDRTRLQNDCLVGPRTVIDEDVMIAARVTFIGDPTMGRGPLPALGTQVRRGARIGVAAIISPPVTIGEEAVVGAGSFVRADVPARTIVVGTPAVRLREVRADELLDGLLNGQRRGEGIEPSKPGITRPCRF